VGGHVRPSVPLSVTLYGGLKCLSDFHEIQYRHSLTKSFQLSRIFMKIGTVTVIFDGCKLISAITFVIY